MEGSAKQLLQPFFFRFIQLREVKTLSCHHLDECET
jgi:hypothetical protein